MRVMVKVVTEVGEEGQTCTQAHCLRASRSRGCHMWGQQWRWGGADPAVKPTLEVAVMISMAVKLTTDVGEEQIWLWNRQVW